MSNITMSPEARKCLPCPFCGREANITNAPHGPRVYCKHDSTCLMRALIVYDFQLREWNRRLAADAKTKELEKYKSWYDFKHEDENGYIVALENERDQLRAKLEQVEHELGLIGSSCYSGDNFEKHFRDLFYRCEQIRQALTPFTK